MLYTLESEVLSFSLDEKGLTRSIYNKRTGREYVRFPGEPFRLIFAEGDYWERSVDAQSQDAPSIRVDGDVMNVCYKGLKKDGETLDVSLVFTYRIENELLRVSCRIENRSDAVVPEVLLSPFAGIGGLSDDPSEDTLIVPRRTGYKIPDPYRADFFKHSVQFKRKYERPDQRHSDFDVPYPGFGCMQWYSLYNTREGIYVSNRDTLHRTVSLHTERRVKDGTLRLGIAHYPFLNKGESYDTPDVVYALLDGDWHEGAKIYRRWMNEENGYVPPTLPKWAKEFEGWSRVIFRTQSGEYNYRFSDIPALFDAAKAAGLNTLFILGWPKGGFGRLRPDYYVDESQREDLLRGIKYVHDAGGKVIMYVSYHAVDRFSKYYTEENGEETLMRDVYGDYVRFSETYSVDATYRKILNNPRSQYCTCSGSDKWHEKMKESADYCLSLGADGVLYDLGGTKPLFCFAEGHDHKKPNTSRSSKAARYADLRRNIKRFGEERAILEEHCIDIYSQNMDIVQPPVFNARDTSSPEMFRYTFPEIRMTNRNMAMDEEKMYDNIGYSFIYGLAFDMSVYRCCGDLRDVPNYAKLMKKAIELRKSYPQYFKEGKFVDTDFFRTEGDVMRSKAYLSPDGRLGVAVWNDTGRTAKCVYESLLSGKKAEIELEKDRFCFVEL